VVLRAAAWVACAVWMVPQKTIHFYGVYFNINDLIYFVDWNNITLNGRSIIMTFLFDWMSLWPEI